MLKPADPEFETKVRASFQRQSLMQTLGADLAQVMPGSVHITAPVADGLLQQQGFAHGGFVFAIGDSAAGYSALSLQEAGAEVLTIEMKANFLSTADTGTLIARGRVIRAGRKIVVVAADVYARSPTGEAHIAALQGTMMVVPA